MSVSRLRSGIRARRLNLFALENRLAPAVATLAAGVLTIDYTASGSTPENVTVSNDGANIALTGNVTGTMSFPTAAVERLVVQDSGGGNAQSLTLAGSSHFDLNAGFISSGVETVAVNKPIVASGAAISISAPGNITLNAGLNTAGGELTIAADSDADGIGTLTVAGAATAGWTAQTHLAASDGAVGDQLGWSVAISGDGNTALLGAPQADVNGKANQGAAYVFTRTGSAWTLQQKLLAGANSKNAQFGFSVALSSDGDTAIVGAPTETFDQGAAWVFTRSASVWSIQTRLDPAEVGGQQYFGYSVAVSSDGNTAVVGAPLTTVDYTYQGAVLAFRRSAGVWSPPEQIVAPSSGTDDWFGFRVSLSANANTVVVKASSGLNVFEFSSNSWLFEQVISGTDTFAFSADGETLAFVNATRSVSLHTRSASNWTEQQKLSIDNGPNGLIGTSLAFSADGGTLLVAQSAVGTATIQVAPSVSAFARQGNTWHLVQRFTDPSGTSGSDFADSLALSADGRTLLWGAPFHSSEKGWGGVFTLGTNFNTGAEVRLSAAALSLTAPVNGGHVTVVPSQPGRAISVGAAAAGAFSVSSTDVTRLIAPTQIGDDQSGPLTVNGNITLPDVLPWTLKTPAALTVNAAITTRVGSLALSGGTVSSSAAGVIKTAGANVTITSTGPGDQTLAGAVNTVGYTILTYVNGQLVSTSNYRGDMAVRSAKNQPIRFTSVTNDVGKVQIDTDSTVVVEGGFGTKSLVLVAGVLGGTGGVSTVTLAPGATLAPGVINGTGKLSAAQVTFNAASTFSVRIDGTSYSQLSVSSRPNLNGAKLTGSVAAPPSAGQVMKIIDNTSSSSIIGTFDGLPEGALATISGRQFIISYKGGPDNDVTLRALPGVSSITFGDGTNQRSMVKQLVVTFSEPMSFTGPVADAFKLTRTGSTGEVALTANPVSGPAGAVTLTFSGDLTEFNSLVDGFYNLTIDATKITNPHFDGNADGQPGGNYAIVGSTTNKFFRLFGDVDGSGTVDLTDFTAFRAASGSLTGQPNYNAAFDFEGDGDVDLHDLIRFRQRVGMTP